MSAISNIFFVNIFHLKGIGGSGRASASRLAAFMSDYELFQIEITKNYTLLDWREDVKKMLRKAGYDGISTVFLFGDHQVKVSLLLLSRIYYENCGEHSLTNIKGLNKVEYVIHRGYE